MMGHARSDVSPSRASAIGPRPPLPCQRSLRRRLGLIFPRFDVRELRRRRRRLNGRRTLGQLPVAASLLDRTTFGLLRDAPAALGLFASLGASCQLQTQRSRRPILPIDARLCLRLGAALAPLGAAAGRRLPFATEDPQRTAVELGLVKRQRRLHRRSFREADVAETLAVLSLRVADEPHVLHRPKGAEGLPDRLLLQVERKVP
mmetsp:Transcript_14822/g.47185  ORF Transcript_14822/g.47185 Transcript_14822/m.47185 type:complete len:204 (+) Transcript_14822:127-738(+)